MKLCGKWRRVNPWGRSWSSRWGPKTPACIRAAREVPLDRLPQLLVEEPHQPIQIMPPAPQDGPRHPTQHERQGTHHGNFGKLGVGSHPTGNEPQRPSQLRRLAGLDQIGVRGRLLHVEAGYTG